MEKLPLYKAITVYVMGDNKYNTSITFKFEELDKALNDGYTIEAVHQISSSGGSSTILAGAYLTFVLKHRNG